MPLVVKTHIVEFSGLICPFRAGVFGSTRTGKTTLIYNLLNNNMFVGSFQTIYYCYPAAYSDQPLNWHEDLSYDIQYKYEFIKSMDDNSLLILDDFWTDACQSDAVKKLFTSVSGKRNISIFITSQNPYDGGSNARTIRNNLNYYFLLKNLGDHQINKRLCSQLGFLPQYTLAANRIRYDRRGFVMINLDVTLEFEQLRVMTNLFEIPIAYT